MPPNTRPHIDDAGFTLAEMIVAIAIVMVVGMAVLGGTISALSAQRAAEGHDVAVRVAVDRLEEVSQLEWDRVGFYEPTQASTGQTGYDYTPYYPCGSTTACAAEPVSLLAGTPPANPLHATVTMSGYKVHTYITWVLPTGETVYPVNQEGDTYAAKRVRVVVEGTRDGDPVRETVETVIAPRVNQTPPPGIPAGSAPIEATTSTEAASAPTSTCPSVVTAVGSPPVVGWNSVAEGVTSYRVFVNGSLRDLVTHDGRSRYAWTSPLYATATTYEVRGVSTTGQAAPCTPVTWDPANPG